MSSSDFPENIEPAITSIQPGAPCPIRARCSSFPSAMSLSIRPTSLSKNYFYDSFVNPRVVERREGRDERRLETHRARQKPAREDAPSTLPTANILLARDLVNHVAQLAPRPLDTSDYSRRNGDGGRAPGGYPRCLHGVGP